MNIEIISVGKLKEKYWKMAVDEYLKRLSAYAKVKIIEVSDEEDSENFSKREVENAKIREGKRILEKISDKSFVITLEIEGNALSSEAFANYISEEMLSGNSDMTFVIGGSNGLSKEVSDRADYKLSFSKMTFPHQLMRVILLEQIYRAFRIINGHPYHK